MSYLLDFCLGYIKDTCIDLACCAFAEELFLIDGKLVKKVDGVGTFHFRKLCLKMEMLYTYNWF
jgi:hypothetical protein